MAPKEKETKVSQAEVEELLFGKLKLNKVIEEHEAALERVESAIEAAAKKLQALTAKANKLADGIEL